MRNANTKHTNDNNHNTRHTEKTTTINHEDYITTSNITQIVIGSKRLAKNDYMAKSNHLAKNSYLAKTNYV